jgi:hypothetical protein
MFLSILVILALLPTGQSFAISEKVLKRPASHLNMSTASTAIYEPSERDALYGRNTAQYLVDLHDMKATFDFCGGMMFQLALSDKLREHLLQVAKDGVETKQPIIFDASKPSMSNLEGYCKEANADNISIFHGREIRQVPNAEGGMGFVLQLSLADNNDPEGWSPEEIATYDGWGHDSGRTWRKADMYEQEGFKTFKSTYGPKAFGLNHRCYLHLDSSNRMWLSAEDGCEGTPAVPSTNPFQRLFR